MTTAQALRELPVLFAFMVAAALGLYLEPRRWLHLWLHRGRTPRPHFWPTSDPRNERLLSLASSGTFALGLLCLCDGFFIEPGAVEAVTVRLASPKVAPATGVLRIVQLSDIHSERRVRGERRAVELVNGLKPDLVVLTGDYLNDPAALPVLRAFLAALKPAFGVYLVTGNMDDDLPRDAFAGLGVTVLDRSTREVEVRGTRLRLSGMPVADEPYFKRLMGGAGQDGRYGIFLYHYSDLVYEAERAGVDLYLSGHTHGGQVRLPFYGAIVTLARYGKRFEAGRYQVGDTTLYVNRGLGMEGGRAPRVRFLCRPEVTLFEIEPARPAG